MYTGSSKTEIPDGLEKIEQTIYLPSLKKIHGILGPGKDRGLAVLHVDVMKGGDVDVCLGMDRDL